MRGALHKKGFHKPSKRHAEGVLKALKWLLKIFYTRSKGFLNALSFDEGLKRPFANLWRAIGPLKGLFKAFVFGHYFSCLEAHEEGSVITDFVTTWI